MIPADGSASLVPFAGVIFRSAAAAAALAFAAFWRSARWLTGLAARARRHQQGQSATTAMAAGRR